MPVIISSISISCAQVQHQTLLSFRWDLRPPNKAFLILHAVPAGGWGIAIHFWSMKKKNSCQIAKCRIQDERENTRLKDKYYVIHSDIHNWRCCTIDFIIDYFAVSFFFFQMNRAKWHALIDTYFSIKCINHIQINLQCFSQYWVQTCIVKFSLWLFPPGLIFSCYWIWTT